jgi:lysozyme inhibitor LprI
MKRNILIRLSVVIGVLGLVALVLAEEKESEMEYVSPKGTYHIERVAGQDEPLIVSTKNSADRAPLPGASNELDPSECQVGFYYSPDENWIFYTEHWRHHGLLARELYHHETGVKFVPVSGKRSFTKAIQSYAVKKGGFKQTNFVAEHEPNYDHLGTEFRGWSLDSGRLLIGVYAETSERGPFYVYFNTRTKSFEQTPYLRQVNKNVTNLTSDYATDVVCVEPLAPLPPASELKARLDALDAKLTTNYEARLQPTKKDDVNDLKEAQRKWLQMRDEGLQTYLGFARKGEEEKQRLQFLGDVTATRIEELNQLTIPALTR